MSSSFDLHAFVLPGKTVRSFSEIVAFVTNEAAAHTSLRSNGGFTQNYDYEIRVREDSVKGNVITDFK